MSVTDQSIGVVQIDYKLTTCTSLYQVQGYEGLLLNYHV